MNHKVIALAALTTARRAAMRPAPVIPDPIGPSEQQIRAAVRAVLAGMDLRGPPGLDGDDAEIDSERLADMIDELVEAKIKALPKPKPNLLDKGVFQMRTVLNSVQSADTISFKQSVVTANGNRALNATDFSAAGEVLVLADATAGAITITLPSAATVIGKKLFVKRINVNANTVIVQAFAGERIDLDTSAILNTPMTALELFPQAGTWWIV